VNAIILAAGNSLRMYQTGANIHKALLPIQNIPNIERTILMLQFCNITEIIIAVPYQCTLFDYLAEKYSCKIIYKKKECANTLHTINDLLTYIDDTFIIEGDVVLAKNIFDIFENSTYYVMKYPKPEIDDWHPVLNQDGNISTFQISQENTAAIFGISFWAHKDCPLLISHLKQKAAIYDIQDPDIFWDNNIIEILDRISVKTYEISADVACEMNTYEEYKFAQEICKSAIYGSLFFDNVTLRTENDIHFKICHSTEKETNIYWLDQLFNYYGEELFKDSRYLAYEDFFSTNEQVFIIKIGSLEVGFFSFVHEKKYILLRRLYVSSNRRNKHIGTQIVRYIQLYSKFNSKEFRVNVYDDDAEKFYNYLGFKLKFKTFGLEV
jgi:CTP:phosphocholine cytidylyltransferase-like protein/N-acetylglutamate synthase-like GNAT family acetyltransferase